MMSGLFKRNRWFSSFLHNLNSPTLPLLLYNRQHTAALDSWAVNKPATGDSSGRLAIVTGGARGIGCDYSISLLSLCIMFVPVTNFPATSYLLSGLGLLKRGAREESNRKRIQTPKSQEGP